MNRIEYSERRDRWLHVAKNAGFHVESAPHPLKGSQKEDLFIDFAFKITKSPVLLVHIAGTHGIEGYLGSQVQEELLQHSEIIDSKLNLCFVHPLNPYGMSWRRRTNHQNIDLNRNGIEFSKTRPNNRDYREVSGIISADSWWSRAGAVPHLIKQLVQWGPRRLLGAFASGQYDFPEGLFFGGQELSWELSTLLSTLKKHFAEVERIFVLDVHTGLGSYGNEYLIADDCIAVEEVHSIQAIFKAPLHLSKEAGYPITGSVGTAVAEAFTTAQTQSLVQEFGTFDALSNLIALIQENQLWQLGERNNLERENLITKVFFPPDEKWRRDCVDLGIRRCVQWIQSISHQAP